MEIIANIFVNILGFVILLFIFWKKLRDDYSSEIIFKSASCVFLGISIFYLMSFNFIPSWFLWLSFIGAIAGLLLAHLSQRVRFYECLEILVVSSLPWLSLLFLQDSIKTSSFISFISFVTVLVLMFLAYWLDANYKSFYWYRSGKIGVSGLIVLATIFTIRLTVAFFEIPVLSLLGNWEFILSGTFLLADLFLIYRISKT